MRCNETRNLDVRISWIHGLPNIKRKSETRSLSSPGTQYTFNFNFGEVPDLVTYRYYDYDSGYSFPFDRQSVEVSINGNSVTYQIPPSGSVSGVGDFCNFNSSQDYFEVEVTSYIYSNEGENKISDVFMYIDWDREKPAK
jgi:hypothetical protein